MRTFRIYLSAFIFGALLYPAASLFRDSRTVAVSYTPTSVPVSGFYPGIPVDPNIVGLIRGLLAVQNYDAVDDVIQRLDDDIADRVLVDAISNEIATISKGIKADVARQQSDEAQQQAEPQLSQDSDPDSPATESRKTDGEIVIKITTDLVRYVRRLEGLKEYVASIESPSVRAQAYLELAAWNLPDATANDQNLLLKSFESMKLDPDIWKSTERVFQESIDSKAPEVTASGGNYLSATSLNSWAPGSIYLGLLFVAFMWFIRGFLQVPIQNAGKAYVPYFLHWVGLKYFADATRTGEIFKPKRNDSSGIAGEQQIADERTPAP